MTFKAISVINWDMRGFGGDRQQSLVASQTNLLQRRPHADIERGLMAGKAIAIKIRFMHRIRWRGDKLFGAARHGAGGNIIGAGVQRGNVVKENRQPFVSGRGRATGQHQHHAQPDHHKRQEVACLGNLACAEMKDSAHWIFFSYHRSVAGISCRSFANGQFMNRNTITQIQM